MEEQKDTRKFIGQFRQQGYILKKQYLQTDENFLKLYHTKYTPQDPKYTLCLIHGFGQHSGRYKHVAQFFVSKGFQVITVDLRDFGCSGFGTTAMRTITDYQNDIIRLLKQARQDLPLFFYGHSMGGLLVAKMVLNCPQIKVSGCILSSPALGFQNSVLTPDKRFIVKILGGLFPENALPAEIRFTQLSKNEKILDSYIFDPLIVKSVSLRSVKSMIEASDEVRKRSGEIKVPIQIFHGKKDYVIDSQVSRKFVYDQVTPFKNLYIYQDGYHELHNDFQINDLFERCMKFIDGIANKKPLGNNKFNLIKPKKSGNLKKFVILGIIFVIIWFIRKYISSKGQN